MAQEMPLTDWPEPVLADRRLGVLLVALLGGAFAELMAHSTLFGGKPIGVGLVILLMIPVGILTAGVLVVGVAPSRYSLGWLIAALAILPWIAVRAAPALILLNLASAIGLVCLAAYRYRSEVPSLGITEHLRVVAWVPFAVLAQPLRFLRTDLAGTMVAARRHHQLGAVLRGVALAALPLIVFGALLASADAVFSNLVGSLFGFHPGEAFKVIGGSLFVAWVVIGLLRFSVGTRLLVEIPREAGYLGTTEVLTILGSLSAMFAAFVVIQFTYLFGGVDTIEATGGLTRAEYYRQGFFQLVVVAGLVVLLVLVLDWWHRPRDTGHYTVVLALFEVLIALTGIMVVSALIRLRLYVDSFGLSQLRVYTAALVVWIAVVLVLLGLLVLTGRREPLAPGAIATAVVIVLALNVLSPDALITRVNIDHARDRGTELDLDYLGTLSDDAVPSILEGRAAGAGCTDLESVARSIAGDDVGGDFRAFHWSRSAADDAVAGIAATSPC